MKKFTKFGAILIATAFMLTGCGNKGGDTSAAPTTAPTSTPTSEPTSAPVVPAVSSVTVTPKTLELGLEEHGLLTAKVVTVGGASNAVTWSSSDESVATVSATGSVTALKEGTATITATSVFDSTKSDISTVKVVDKGFNPALYDEGYKYYKAWPEDVIKEWIGDDSVTIVAPENASLGAYVWEEPASEYAAYLEVIVSGDQLLSYLGSLEDADFIVWSELMYGLFQIDCAIDPSLTYEVDPSENYNDDYEVDGLMLTFYHVDDLFYDDTLTTNTDWTAAEKAEFEKVDGLEALPFVQLGEQYEVEALESYEEEDVYEGVAIYDGSLAIHALDSYGETLAAAGFTYNEEFGTYGKTIADAPWLEQYVSFSWGSYGNYIETGIQNVTFSEFPQEYVDMFTAYALGSKYQVLAPEGADADTFQWSSGLTEDEEMYMAVYGYSYSYEEFEAYAAALEADGWDVEYEEQTDEQYGYIGAEKGYIYIEAQFINDVDYDDDWNPIYLDESGELDMYILQGSGYEDPGIYVKEKTAKVGVGTTYTVQTVLYEIEGTPTFTSDHPEIASVDASTGVVTGVAVGSATITASVVYNEVTYSATVAVSVVNEVEDVLTIDDLSPVEKGKTVYTNFSGVNGASGAVYAGQCAGGGDYKCIQIRSKNSNSGIVSTTSGGTLKSIEVTFNANQTNTSALNVYASESPIESAEALYTLTPVATMTPGAGETVSITFPEGTNFKYVGIASSSGAMYIDEIVVTWAA